MEIFNYCDPSLVFLLSLLHCFIGLASAIVADTKGYSFVFWLFIGAIGGSFALITSFTLKSKLNTL